MGRNYGGLGVGVNAKGKFDGFLFGNTIEDIMRKAKEQGVKVTGECFRVPIQTYRGII